MRSNEAEELFQKAQASFRDHGDDGAGGFSNTQWVIRQAEAARALAPEDPEILLFLASRHLDNLSGHLAVPLYEAVVRIATRDGDQTLMGKARAWHGFYLFMRGRREEALQDLRAAALLTPDDPELLAFKAYLEKELLH